MNRTAVITGASSGIGLELAGLMAFDRIDLVLASRNREKLETIRDNLTKKYGIKVKIIQIDLSDEASPDKLFDEVKKSGLQIDYLINNAGFGDYGFFIDSDPDKLSRMIDLNIKTLTRLTRLFAPLMVLQGRGAIMNVASTAAFQPGPLMAVYYATKAYVLSFSQALAKELEGSGVTVTALCPGATDTGFKSAANLEGSKLFAGKRIASALDVARYGYKAMLKGKRIAVHGIINSLLVFSVRLMPSSLVTDFVMKIQGRRKAE
ncbi:MAG: SDR family oxidoreductase [Spirochaetales bacterium]|nr:SDR family oxidoreductase [Spirochaetales bacterium]